MEPSICLVLTTRESPSADEYPPTRFWLEVRIDALNDFDYYHPEKHDEWILSLLAVYDKVILTFRSKNGDDQKNEIRHLCYSHWIALGVPYIDVDFYEPFSEELILLCKKANRRTQIILSHHIFSYDGNLERVRLILQAMYRHQPAIAKMAVLCTSGAQALDLLSLYAEFPHALILAMGSSGGFSRFAIPYLGAPYTYAAYTESNVSGLLPISVIRPIFDRWHRLNEE